MDTAVQNEKTDLGTGKVGRLLFRLAIPTVAAQVVNVLYNMVDRMYIGHIDVIGAQALTGVGVCMPLIMICLLYTSLLFRERAFQLLKALVADRMLDAAGVLFGGLGVHPRFGQPLREKAMAFIDLLRKAKPLFGQFKVVSRIRPQQPVRTERGDGPAYAGPRIAETARDVYRPYRAAFLLQDQDRFQIILAGFI